MKPEDQIGTTMLKMFSIPFLIPASTELKDDQNSKGTTALLGFLLKVFYNRETTQPISFGRHVGIPYNREPSSCAGDPSIGGLMAGLIIKR